MAVLWEHDNIIERWKGNYAKLLNAQSHIRDARSAHRKMKNKTSASLWVQLLSNCCQNLGEASELTTHAQRIARALGVYRYSAHTERTC